MEHEIQFINPPPYDFTCPVCLQLLKDAYQTMCCGNHICSDCVTRLKHIPEVKCPHCRHDTFNAIPDKFFSRLLLNLEVRCHFSKVGCTWTGELRRQEQHLEASCKRGIVTYEHCNSQMKEDCWDTLLDCPNRCSNGLSKHKKIQDHLENECPLRIIHLSRDSIPFTANKVIQTAPLSFTMTGFSRYLENKDPWFSPPFYTHNECYKVCVRIDADGMGKVSVVVCVLKGEYDHMLDWPLHAEVEISLYNWRHNTNDLTKSLYLPGDHFCSQNPNDKLTQWGTATTNFTEHINLVYTPDYLQHNCLNIRINKVVIFPTPIISELPPWATEESVCQFVVTSFAYSTRKDATFCGPPFYTHVNGYKLAILVYVNGNDTGKGSHVSLYATLMKGEHDNILSWLFSGDIFVSILNWRENKNHLECIIRFNKGITSAATARVVAGRTLALKSCGHPKFVAHTNLPYNQSTNIEFLKDDCLLFKVKSVVVYSRSSSISRCPSWRHEVHNLQSLHEFTLNHFSVRKASNNEYFSDAFFSHSNGYKMQLRVNTNQDGHVGVFVCLMKGPNDDYVMWPFSSDIVVELLNWRNDSRHYKKIIELSQSVPDTARNRVTDGERSLGWGHDQYIQHSALEVNYSNNTEYLQADCLYFRVKEVAVYSTALCQKSPLWQPVLLYPEFTLTNFSKHRDLGTKYISNEFLTHNHGYKMRLEVTPCMIDHVAVYTRIMKGENDDNLVWPFEGDVIIELLNWRRDVNHHSHTISFNERTATEIRSRVTSGETNPSSGWGTDQFISCSSLRRTTNTEYLQDNCLRFRVKEVVVYSTPNSSKIPVWQSRSTSRFSEFTITQFSHRVRLESVFFSGPFYSSPQGYKMCLKVYPGGSGSCKGTHVSMYAFLLKGDHDDVLCWPFTGDVVIEILNWKNCYNHRRKVLQFDNDSSDDSRARVREADGLAPSGWGSGEIVPLNVLYPRYASDTQYLKDDCMRIRVYDVAVYNTPLLSKTPQWQNWFYASSSWLSEFTVTGVSKHKLYDTEHISPPFYTHKNGYKMRLHVWPNGKNDGKGTHLSIFAHLLKGENDNNLKWPMNIDLTVELINWRSKYSHIMHVIKFGDAPETCCAQVTGENKTIAQGWGCNKFYAHCPLFGNSEKYNIQFVQDDCLRIRVKGAKIYSRKGLFS